MTTEDLDLSNTFVQQTKTLSDGDNIDNIKDTGFYSRGAGTQIGGTHPLNNVTHGFSLLVEKINDQTVKQTLTYHPKSFNTTYTRLWNDWESVDGIPAGWGSWKKFVTADPKYQNETFQKKGEHTDNNLIVKWYSNGKAVLVNLISVKNQASSVPVYVSGDNGNTGVYTLKATNSDSAFKIPEEYCLPKNDETTDEYQNYYMIAPATTRADYSKDVKVAINSAGNVYIINGSNQNTIYGIRSSFSYPI